jgi:hypothetical protein
MRVPAFLGSLALLVSFSNSALLGQAVAAKYPILNWQQLEARGPSVGMRLFFYLLRNQPDLLSDEDVLRNFMAANNCLNNAFPRALTSEFDYPGMKAFYQSKAPEIVKTSPMTLSLLLKGFYFGQYDAAKGVFPLVDVRGTKPTPTTFHDLEPGNDLHDTCPNLNNNGLARKRNFLANYLRYRVNVPPVSISELPMNAADARSLVEGLRSTAPPARGLTLLVDMDLVDAPAKLGSFVPGSGYPPVDVQGKIKKITIFSVQGNKTLGVIAP